MELVIVYMSLMLCLKSHVRVLYILVNDSIISMQYTTEPIYYDI